MLESLEGFHNYYGIIKKDFSKQNMQSGENKFKWIVDMEKMIKILKVKMAEKPERVYIRYREKESPFEV